MQQLEGGKIILYRDRTSAKAALKLKEPQRIFTCSWSDFFIDEADAWRADAWEIIRNTPQHTYQILTKRIERVKECLPPDWGDGYENVWLGVSVENQEMADKRIPELLQTPARIRWISAEPLLEKTNFDEFLQLSETNGSMEFLEKNGWGYDLWSGGFTGPNTYHDSCYAPEPGIHWVVVGGESGNEAGYFTYRHCQLEWIEDIVDQCRAVGVPVFVKQLGTSLAGKFQLKDRFGGDMDEWPPALQIREFPVTGDK